VDSPAPAAPAAEQPDLPGLAEAFRAVGIENLPIGVTALSRREQRFCLEYLRTGLWTEAARTAGYADPEKNAAKLRKNTGIAAFLAQASTALTEETKQLIIRAEERSRALQQLLRDEMERAPEKRKVNRIAKLAAAANRTDTLLGALKGIGKVSSVGGAIDVNHNHTGEVALTVPATALPVLAEMRQDAVRARMGGPN
jgi:hypothetical protein